MTVTTLPLVSVIIPAYNAEAFIGQALDSVLAQTYTNIEVFVVDDGSQDRTPEIVKFFAQKDHRVILVQQPNMGVAAARNLAIQSSTGEYIAPIDADDIWYPQKLEKQVQCMLEVEPSVGVVYVWSVNIDEQGLPTGVYIKPNQKGEVYTELLYRNFIGNASAPLIRRACLERVGSYNCKLKEQNGQGLEDWDIYLRIAECYQFGLVPELLVGYRQVIGSMSFNDLPMEKSFYLIMASAKARRPEISDTVLRKATINHYFYLGWKNKQSSKHWRRVFWLYKALRADWIVLLEPGFYEAFIKTVLTLIANPITSLIWPDHHSWLQFKQRLKFNYIATLSNYHINKQIQNRR